MIIADNGYKHVRMDQAWKHTQSVPYGSDDSNDLQSSYWSIWTTKSDWQFLILCYHHTQKLDSITKVYIILTLIMYIL